ncbi:hypothetical protein BKA70DRAFT_1090717 [Coprinopsis sp. MPI-PUGE-AT-0042]|nr:hypothetical protein BKA70DRAFT_1090717 [Coprinopsis sp. MPI-PUGE-AT-0042]
MIGPQGDNLSNGERLRRGLSPKSPRYAHTPTRAQAAQSAAASPVSRTGYFKIVKADNSDAGFVSKSFNIFGDYGLTDNVEDALPISFLHASGDSSLFDISNRNSEQLSAYPFIGFTNGFASDSETFSKGSINYAFMTGVSLGRTDSKPNSFSAATGIPELSQSTVWKFDAGSNELSVEWANPDASVDYHITSSLLALADLPEVRKWQVGKWCQMWLGYGVFDRPRCSKRHIPRPKRVAIVNVS